MKSSTALLINKCNTLASSKFLLCKRYINDLLRLVAFDKEIFAIAQDCIKSFNYETEFDSSIVIINNREALQLPKNNKRIIALTLNILHGFDKDSSTICPFLERFYASSSPNASFELFVKDVIIPFREAMVSLLEDGYEEEVEELVDETANVVKTVPDGALHSIDNIVRNIHAKLANIADIDPQLRADYDAIADGFYYTMTTRDVRLIRPAFLGFKYSLGDYKPIAREVKDAEAALKLFLII